MSDKSYRDALADFLVSEKNVSPVRENAFDMNAAYASMRPHQRGFFNVIGAAAQGAKGIYDSGANAFGVMHRILGNGAPVTMDDIQHGARDAATFAMPGSMKTGVAGRDATMASRFGGQSETINGSPFLPHPENRIALPANFGRNSKVVPFENDPYPGVTAPVEQYARAIEERPRAERWEKLLNRMSGLGDQIAIMSEGLHAPPGMKMGPTTEQLLVDLSTLQKQRAKIEGGVGLESRMQQAPMLRDIDDQIAQLQDRIQRSWEPGRASVPPAPQQPFGMIDGGAGKLSDTEGYARAMRSQNAQPGDWAGTAKTAEIEKQLQAHGDMERNLFSQPDYGREGWRARQIYGLFDRERERLADLLEKSYLRPVE